MSLDFATIPSSGTFFKPSEHEDALVLLVEPTAYRKDVVGQYGPKDEATATITVFNTQEQLAGDAEPDVLIGAKFNQTILAGDLETLVGKATIVKLGKRAPKKAGQQPAWVWGPVSNTLRDQVIAYATKREEARKAALGDDAPDFLK